MSVRTPELEKYIEAEPATVGLSGTRLANLSRLIEGYVGDRKTSGAIAAVVRRRKLVHFETYGNMDDEPARPMAADTMFRLFSMTKPITAVGLMSLYEEGRFSLDDAVSRYIPSFKRLKVLDSGEPDDYVLRNPTREMTIKDVLCHTAGLAEVPGAGGQTPTELLARIYFEAGLRGSRPARTLAEMMAKLAELPLAFDPGTRWMYSSSFDVAAHLCELIANRPYDQFLEERIFRPLGITDTCFVVPESKRSRLAANYRPGAPGEPGYVRVNPPPGAGVGDGGTFFSGSGGLVGTASDYLRFARMLANDGNLDGSRILAPRTVRLDGELA